MEKIFEEHYAAGQQAFREGASLRVLMERVSAVMDGPDGDGIALSIELGFADAFLSFLRDER